MSEETVDEAFRDALEKVEEAHKQAVDDVKKKVDRAKSKALAKLKA